MAYDSAATKLSTTPILRWAGGKRHFVSRLLEYLPADAAKRVYREPFLGAGSLFFALQPERAVLSDANGHLIRCYEHVRDEWEVVSKYLRQHAGRNSEAHYYRVRTEYNQSSFSAAQAARFIYLNKTCYNGIFRVNKKGQFNVPYGWKEPPAIPTPELLKKVSAALFRATILTASFKEALSLAGDEDFIYLDPPYPPLNGTAYFTHYTMDRFGERDQISLACLVRQLHARGCLILMTNADTPFIRRLYRTFRIACLPVIRFLTCKPTKHTVNELIITNYEVR